MRSRNPKVQLSVVFLCGVIIFGSCLSSCTKGAEPQSSGEVQIMNFTAQHAELHPGECTALEWRVQGGYSVNLNGEPVDFEGGMDVCPKETTTYRLEIDGGDRIVDSQVTIHVLGSLPSGDGEAPPEQPQPPGDGDAPAAEPQPPEPPAPQPPVSNPPTNKAPETPKNCNKTSTEFITDLAITDIYPGNSPKGQFWLRITNNGPVACQSVNINLGCTREHNIRNSGQSGYHYAEGVDMKSVILNIAPGETQNVPTGLELDFDKASYMVYCWIKTTFTDLNSNNQFYQEEFP